MRSGNGVGLVRNEGGVSVPTLLNRLPTEGEPYVYL
jgi:hypothetical protein